MEKTFVRVRSAKDITIFVTLIIAGSVLIALPTGAGINITGFFMIFAGLLLALFLKTGFKDEATGARFQMKEHYFPQAMNAPLSQAIATKPESVDLSEEDKGTAVKLDIYYSRTTGKAYIQLFEYVPHRYDPCSEIYEYDLARVENLIR